MKTGSISIEKKFARIANFKNTKEGKVIKIFNYKTLEVFLDRPSKSMRIHLQQTQMNLEQVFELETLFSWLTNKTEISSVLITSDHEVFSTGANRKEQTFYDEEKLKKLLEKLQKITYGMLYLPQTFIVDLKHGASTHGIEFSLGADIRVAHESALITFDHVSLGLSPASGGIGLLKNLVGESYAKKWLISSKDIDTDEMLNSGLLFSTYTKKEQVESLIRDIAKQPMLSRIQTKFALLQTVLPQLDAFQNIESKTSNATLKAREWKRDLIERQKNNEFSSTTL